MLAVVKIITLELLEIEELIQLALEKGKVLVELLVVVEEGQAWILLVKWKE